MKFYKILRSSRHWSPVYQSLEFLLVYLSSARGVSSLIEFHPDRKLLIKTVSAVWSVTWANEDVYMGATKDQPPRARPNIHPVVPIPFRRLNPEHLSAS
ncbi:hypothetical protein B0H16DRAFT_727900 [Mycena metata]|uniref:Uncharacterized protein n=1 Tax=Mycena metata TaxID=1033252 RepID=A0AAD7NY11_9AGAR|nr:hypothetical protein B0H16DRAFT_727900 [Mycena metata]